MPSVPPPDPDIAALQQMLHKDLVRRFSEFASYDDATFGALGLWEAAAAFALCIAAPLVLVWLLA